ncbi:YALIA101S03e01684g1_1 [Yarrowia lipolytica]|nr:YALIA101S03e01684g1_1 [Yarrowia lipolytica]
MAASLLPDEIWGLVIQHLDLESLVNIGDTCRYLHALIDDSEAILRSAVADVAPWVELGVDGLEANTWRQCARFVFEQQKQAREVPNESFDDIYFEVLEDASSKPSKVQLIDVTTVDRLPEDFEPIFEKTTMKLGGTGVEVDMKTLGFSYISEPEHKMCEQKYGVDVYASLGFAEFHCLEYSNSSELLIVERCSKGALMKWKDGVVDVDNAYVFQFLGTCSDVQVLPNAMLCLELYEDHQASISYVDHTRRKQIQVLEWISDYMWFMTLQYHGYLWIGFGGHLVPFFFDINSTKVRFVTDRTLVGGYEEFTLPTQGKGVYKRYVAYGITNGIFYDMASGDTVCYDEPSLPRTGNFFAGTSQGKLQFFRISPERIVSLENQFNAKKDHLDEGVSSQWFLS